MPDESQLAEPPEGREVGGHFARRSSGHTPVMPSGLTALKEQRMLNRAIREGWIKDGRWPTEATPTELREKQRGELTMKEHAGAACFLDMPLDFGLPQFQDPAVKATIELAYRRLRQLTVKNVVAMEHQNQADDLAELRANLDQTQAASLSRNALEAIIAQCAEAVRQVAGEDRAKEVLTLLQEQITVDAATRGTSITPDMEAAAMDATIPSGPEDEEQQ